MNGIRKEYFEITWASLRAVVEPSFAVRSVINHSDYLSNVEIVVSTAVSITDTEVVTAGGQTFVYDYVVVATGHVESVPKSRTERLSQYEKGKCVNALERSLILICLTDFFG